MIVVIFPHVKCWETEQYNLLSCSLLANLKKLLPSTLEFAQILWSCPSFPNVSKNLASANSPSQEQSHLFPYPCV